MNLDALASGQSSRETQASSPSDMSLFRDIEQATMPFSVYAAMLSSQLIVMVAGRLPGFDVGPSYRESAVSDCLGMEKFGGDNLIKDWPSFMAHGTSQFWASPAQAELRRVMPKKPAAPSVKARPMPVRPGTLGHIRLERRVAITIRDGIYLSDCACTPSLDKPGLRGRARWCKTRGCPMSEATRRNNYPPGFGAVPIAIQRIDGKHHVAADSVPVCAPFARELIDDTRAFRFPGLRVEGDVIRLDLANASAVYDHVAETLSGNWTSELRI
jgi:hypothetical protein